MALRLGFGPVSLSMFSAALDNPVPVDVAPGLRTRLHTARAVVMDYATGEAPVYGLNTGLGANLGHRLAPGEIDAFQSRILAGRACAVGEPLPADTGHALTLARLLSAARGASGMSLPVFDHLCACFAAGLSPLIPEYGSIGAADPTQNAVWARALMGEGLIRQEGRIVPAGQALETAGLKIPVLAPKDAMALINHSGLSVALSARALTATDIALAAMRRAILLTYIGYGANRQILDPAIHALRASPGQADFAAWLLQSLEPEPAVPARRIQEALSLRTVAPVQGAAEAALTRAIAIWQDEANGASDSPAVLDDGRMLSTPNFHSPALALALEQLALALAMVGNGAVQRMQRMMSPALSGLPRYLSPLEGSSAGMVPLQKTAAAMLAELRHRALPVMFDAAPVSDSVEDMAPMTPQAARKLADCAAILKRLAGMEALVAAQAISLRGLTSHGFAGRLQTALRAAIPALTEDRPLGHDATTAADVLSAIAMERETGR